MATALKLAPDLNGSGLIPLDLRVLVLPNSVETVTPGGIILIEPEVEKKAMAMTKGTLVEAGVNAWEEAAARSPRFRRPAPGDRIIFGKYAGIVIKGKDGREYRLMDDTDIVGLEQ